jgi:hypothetical protein
MIGERDWVTSAIDCTHKVRANLRLSNTAVPGDTLGLISGQRKAAHVARGQVVYTTRTWRKLAQLVMSPFEVSLTIPRETRCEQSIALK